MKATDVRFGARLKLVTREEPPELQALRDVDERKGVQSVDIAFSILRVIEGAERSLSLSEVAERSGHPPSKAHHYMVSLVRNDVVRQNLDGRYDLGGYALMLGLSALSRLDIVERSVEALGSFRDETGEACFVAVWGNRGPTIIRYIEGARPVTVEAKAGLVLPLLNSATGRVFLAWGPETSWRPLAKLELQHAGDGENATDVAALLGSSVRSTGIAAIEGALLPKIAALSLPVFTHDGNVACVITTLGLKGELDVSLTGSIAAKLHALGRDLSLRFGYQSYPALG